MSEVNRHNELYFVQAKPEISDYEFDQLVKKIEAIEQEHPDWTDPNSPTQRTGSDILKGFKQVEHSYPMLSLTNTYSEEELLDFVKRMEKLLESKHPSFNVELKMDGVALALRYEKGVFVQGVTRGDGKKGDDVTANVKTIRNLPMKLHGSDIPDLLEIRGEVYMPLSVFRELNVVKEEEGEDVYANPRNATAGSLKLLDSKEAARRKLHIVIYDAVNMGGKIARQSEVASKLKAWGLPVFEGKYTKLCHSVEEILLFAREIEKVRRALPFEIDGIVVKLDDLAKREGIGFTGKSPRWAVAYKFAPEQAETVIEEITVQVGRTGVLTPVAELKPTLLAGSTIARATLHNQDEIDRKDIRVGDTVIIEKGGDVIPKVVQVVLSKRPKGAKKWHMPESCPSCHKKVAHVEGEVAVRCINPSCSSKNLRRIIFFTAKGAMDIDNLGEKVVEKLIAQGFVKTFSDIYRLTEDELSQIEGFKEKSIHNLLSSIEASKETTLARFIFALGINHVGAKTAELIADYAKDIDRVIHLQEEELLGIEGIGPIAAASIVAFFENKEEVHEIKQLLALGVHPKSPAKKSKSHLFSDKTFVLTGTLPNFTRLEAENLIKERGGKVTSSVSAKTDYLLLGEDPGSKYEKAKKLGIKILDEKAFKSLL